MEFSGVARRVAGNVAVGNTLMYQIGLGATAGANDSWASSPALAAISRRTHDPSPSSAANKAALHHLPHLRQAAFPHQATGQRGLDIVEPQLLRDIAQAPQLLVLLLLMMQLPA